jgi:hypothetical protein
MTSQMIASKKIRRLAGILAGMSIAAFGCSDANDEDASTEVESAESAATETNFLRAMKETNGAGVSNPREFQPKRSRPDPSGDRLSGAR